jgi:hypothetical protein
MTEITKIFKSSASSNKNERFAFNEWSMKVRNGTWSIILSKVTKIIGILNAAIFSYNIADHERSKIAIGINIRMNISSHNGIRSRNHS